MFTAVVTTMDKYQDDILVGGLIDGTKKRGTLKEYQKVVAVGTAVHGIQEGDMVCINPIRYSVKKHQEGSLKDGIITDNPVISYNFPTVLLDGKEHLLLQDRDIDFVITEYEETKDD